MDSVKFGWCNKVAGILKIALCYFIIKRQTVWTFIAFWLTLLDYWNDRRSRRVFLCFYSAIFQLTSAKFQTFAYNSRTVWSSCMKFWQQLEINELHVCTKFRGNTSHDFSSRTRKPPCKFGVKSGLSQKRLKYGKKYFIWCCVLRYPFIPTNPLLPPWGSFLFLFLFFSS